MRWVLIVMLWTAEGGGAAIDSIHGFESREECQAAAALLVERQWRTATVWAVCASQGGY